MSDVPTVELVEQLRRANAGLRQVLAARDAEFEAARLAADAEIAELRAMVRALGLQVAELQHRLDSGSDDSGIRVRRRRRSRSLRRPAGKPNGRLVRPNGVVRRGSGRRTGRGVVSRVIPDTAWPGIRTRPSGCRSKRRPRAGAAATT